MAVFELMNVTLNNVTLPAIFQGHEDDQELMNGARAALDICNTNLGIQGLAAVMQSVGDNRDAHIGCRSQEAFSIGDNASKWGSLKEFIADLELPDVPMPASPLDLDEYFREMINWFSDNNISYTLKDNAFEEATESLEGKIVECDRAQSTFESSYCQCAMRSQYEKFARA